jgi:hypothetical protein
MQFLRSRGNSPKIRSVRLELENSKVVEKTLRRAKTRSLRRCHGESSWTAPTRLLDLIDLDDDAKAVFAPTYGTCGSYSAQGEEQIVIGRSPSPPCSPPSAFHGAKL